MNSTLNQIADSTNQALKTATENMNKALANSPKEYQPFFSDLTNRLMEAMKTKDSKLVAQVQKDILKFVETQRKK